MAEPHDESEPHSAPENAEAEANPSEPLEAEASEAARERALAEAALPVKKKKKKRALAAEAATEPSRDRNRRLREEMSGGRRVKTGGARNIPTRNLEAGEIVDDALARSSQAVGEWLKKHFNVVQWFIIVGVVGWIAFAIYSYRANRAAEQASAKLTTAIRAENARIGSEDSKPDPQTGIVETRPAYATDTARLKAAEQQYRAIAEGGSTAAASFARLGLASVLYDQSRFADAKAAYQAVKDSKLATQDVAVKGRALEGLGMTCEALNDKDGAQKAFGELANLDGLGFGALGAYHQARLALAAANPEKAKELLKDAQKRLDASSSDAKKGLGQPSYLQQSVRDLLRRIDPSAVAASPSALTAEQIQALQEQMGSPAGRDGKGLSTEKLNELLRRMSKSPPGGPSPNAPAPPASAP